MGQKLLKKKTLRCIENHLAYSLTAILRESKSEDFMCVNDYSKKHSLLCTYLIRAFSLLDSINEE